MIFTNMLDQSHYHYMDATPKRVPTTDRLTKWGISVDKMCKLCQVNWKSSNARIFSLIFVEFSMHIGCIDRSS